MKPLPAARAPRAAVRLGHAGLIPFVLLAVAIWLVAPGERAFVGLALVAYGATIASFLGAIHWGWAMQGQNAQPWPSYVWGVVPSLVAWLALLVDPVPGLLTLAALLWLCYAVDRRVYPRQQMPHWLPLRLRLTAVASASCLAGALGFLR